MSPSIPPLLYAFLAVMVLGIVAVLVMTDNKRRPFPPPSAGSRSWWSVVTQQLTAEGDAGRVAITAIESTGARGVTVQDNCASGWVGNWWTNLSRRAQYQVVVEYITGTDDQTTFVCACRPRFSSQLTGRDHAQRLTQQLAARIRTRA